MSSDYKKRPQAFRQLTDKIVPFEMLVADVADIEDVLHVLEPDDGATWPWSATSAFCYRREAVELMFSYEPRILGSTDAYLAHGITALTGGIIIDIPLAIYRRHGGNLFAANADLSAFYAYDITKEAKILAHLAQEIINSYFSNIVFIATRSKDKMLFFVAIKRICRILDAVAPERRSASTHFLEILLANKRQVEEQFGKPIVQRLLRTNARTLRDRLKVFRGRSRP